MESKMVDVGRSNKISCIFGDIDFMATKNADFEITWAVFENPDIIFHLNFLWSIVRYDQNLLINNVGKEDD